MKKFYKVFAAAFAMALVFSAPQATITSHAFGFDADAPEHSCDDGREGSIDDTTDSGSSDSGSSSSDSGSSYSDPSSYDSGSSYEPSSYDGGSSYNADSSYDGGSSDNNVSYVPVVKKNPNDVTMGVEGGQKFRMVMAGDHKSFQVYHCGISKATYTVGNTDGTGVAYKTAALVKGEDNLWYIDITFDETVDITGYSVAVTKGDLSYLSTELGVSGIKLNGTLALSTVPMQ